MQQLLIVASGIEPSQASQTQLNNVSACVQQLSRDPRVHTIYGTTGRSTGCALICAVEGSQDIDQLSGFLQISGFPIVEITPLAPPAALLAGLQQAARVAPVSPQATRPMVMEAPAA